MIGIFIGSFNPPTLAHLEICLKLQKDFKQIVFVPVNSREKYLVRMQDRINMLNIYTHEYSFLKVDSIMKNYSYFNERILFMLKKKYGDIKIILGSDILEKMDYFDNLDSLLKNYSFIVITRNLLIPSKIIKEKYSLYQDNFTILEYHRNISSSKVRYNLQNNASCDNLLHPKIEEYIEVHKLYV